MQMLPSNIIAEVAAEANPTISGENSRAAIHQYPKPSSDVTAVVPINDPALTNVTLFALTHPYENLFTILLFLRKQFVPPRPATLYIGEWAIEQSFQLKACQLSWIVCRFLVVPG